MWTLKIDHLGLPSRTAPRTKEKLMGVKPELRGKDKEGSYVSEGRKENQEIPEVS